MCIKKWILLAALSLGACAQPNYEDANRKPAAGEATDELGACDYQFTNSKICSDLIWEKRPTESEFGSFVLEFYSPGDRSQFIDPPGTLSVILWMPSMAHGTSPTTVEKLATGQYRVSRVFFTMHGDWEFQLKFQSAAAMLDQLVFPFHY